MNLLVIIAVGFLVGLVARLLKPGRDSMGIIMTTLLGIAGAVIGGSIGRALGYYQIGEPAGFIGSIFGAILLLVAVQYFTNRRTA